MFGQPVCYSISLIVAVVSCCDRVFEVVLQATAVAAMLLAGVKYVFMHESDVLYKPTSTNK